MLIVALNVMLFCCVETMLLFEFAEDGSYADLDGYFCMRIDELWKRNGEFMVFLGG